MEYILKVGEVVENKINPIRGIIYKILEIHETLCSVETVDDRPVRYDDVELSIFRLVQDLEPVNQYDLDQLQYYWMIKDDITRYSRYDLIKPTLERDYPEILEAFGAYNLSIYKMSNVINNLKLI